MKPYNKIKLPIASPVQKGRLRGVTRPNALRASGEGGLAFGCSPEGRTAFVESVVSTPGRGIRPKAVGSL